MDEQAAMDATRGWVIGMVIGLNLCPFAHRVAEAGRIRYAATGAEDAEELLAALKTELSALAAAPRSAVETTLLIHPRALANFSDFNDFLPEADRLVRRIGLRGVIQVVGFHPAYCFADTPTEGAENYTNRSPYPMLHLLREESISEVSGDPAALAAIPRRNIETLRGMGLPAILARFHASAATSGDSPLPPAATDRIGRNQ
ncbi:MAG: DUF1415 domain-containing protein [Gemmataceae bacterium]|nr:DUF1415 domain-containing protein [Gemmataceae bacterium]